jgi:hypothetical protein
MNTKQLLEDRSYHTPASDHYGPINSEPGQSQENAVDSAHGQKISAPSIACDEIPPALAALANGRDLIDTPELSRVTFHAKQTIRKLYSQQGHYFGIRPIKIGNKNLWPVRPVANLIRKGSK